MNKNNERRRLLDEVYALWMRFKDLASGALMIQKKGWNVS